MPLLANRALLAGWFFISVLLLAGVFHSSFALEKLSLANGFNSFLIDDIKGLTRIVKTGLKQFFGK
jgi:hypothetical protein